MPKLFKKDVEPKEKNEKKLSKKEKKAIEEQNAERIAKEKLDAERCALLQLSEKELLVEMILALRSYDERIIALEKKVGSAAQDANIAALNSAAANLNRL